MLILSKKMDKKVLLIYCGEKSRMPHFPLSVMALASYIRKFGYEPEICDLRLNQEVDFFPKPLCVCFSAMSGPDLKSGIETAKWVKGKYPDIPIIWGGHHASALPEQTLKEDYVDAVIIGEGEKAILNCLQDIEKGKLKEVYNQELIDMNELDMPAYDLIDIEKYLDYKNEWSYEVARGCPFRCRFCYVHYFHGRKWRAKSVEKIVKEISYLVDRYKIKKLKFIGDNFFVDKKMALEVCMQIAPFNLKWSSSMRIDQVYNFSDEEMKIIKESGCTMILAGIESGSEEILEYMQKDITIKQAIEAVKKCMRFGIIPFTAFMIGVPGENRQQIMKTLDMYDQVEKLGALISSVFVYGPYPGTPMYKDSIKMGYTPPSKLEDWADLQPRRYRLPWHGKMGQELETITRISRFKFFIRHMNSIKKEDMKKKTGIPMWMIKSGILPFRVLGYLRWKYRFFKYDHDFRLFFNILKHYTEVY